MEWKGERWKKIWHLNEWKLIKAQQCLRFWSWKKHKINRYDRCWDVISWAGTWTPGGWDVFRNLTFRKIIRSNFRCPYGNFTILRVEVKQFNFRCPFGNSTILRVEVKRSQTTKRISSSPVFMGRKMGATVGRKCNIFQTKSDTITRYF